MLNKIDHQNNNPIQFIRIQLFHTQHIIVFVLMRDCGRVCLAHGSYPMAYGPCASEYIALDRVWVYRTSQPLYSKCIILKVDNVVIEKVAHIHIIHT